MIKLSRKKFQSRLASTILGLCSVFFLPPSDANAADCLDTSGKIVTISSGTLCGSLTGGFGDVAPYNTPDGVLDISDAVVALRISLGLISNVDATYKGKADVAPICVKSNTGCTKTGDGTVDISDAVVILRLALGLVDPAIVVWPTSGTTTSAQNYTNSLGMTFKLIPAGTFMMGSPSTETDRQSTEDPQHQVTISKAFYMQTTEMTQGQWKAVMGSNPSSFSSCGDTCPVENVSWNDIQTFLTKLNAKGEGTYNLPTEAQWEYAVRAGTTTAYSFGDGDPPCQSTSQDLFRCFEGGGFLHNKLGDYGWDAFNSSSKTNPVATKLPNPWGLYDMHGNVGEWVQDWYGSYSSAAATDPIGPTSGSDRVFRGYCWRYISGYLRSATRCYIDPSNRNDRLGLRLSIVP